MCCVLAIRLSRFPGGIFPLWCTLNTRCVKSWLWICSGFWVTCFSWSLWRSCSYSAMGTAFLLRACSLQYFCAHPCLMLVESGLRHYLQNKSCHNCHQQQPYIHFPEAKRHFPTKLFQFSINIWKERDYLFPYSVVEKTDTSVNIESVSLWFPCLLPWLGCSV